MAKPKGPRFSYVQKHSPDYKKPYGSSYTERQIAILSGFISLENIREAELGLLFRKAEQMGDIDNYEIAKMLYDLKMDPGKYFPRYTIEQAKDIIQSHIPTITDCSGTIYFTDLQLQEGPALTSYAPHTEICLKESENVPVWFNGIVRSEETVILLNLGGTSAALDIHLYPKQYMDGGSVTLAQGVGGQKATFPNAMNAGDDVALLASTRECTRNGAKETKDGFYQYSAAWDSKHIVSLPQGKSAQLLYSMQEMDDGGMPL